MNFLKNSTTKIKQKFLMIYKSEIKQAEFFKKFILKNSAFLLFKLSVQNYLITPQAALAPPPPSAFGLSL